MAKEKATQLVQLYERKTKKGITYYLHYTLNGVQVRENTHLRLSGNKDSDKVVKKAAQMLQADRTAEILSGRTGIATSSQKSNILLTDYCEKVAGRISAGEKTMTEIVKRSQIKRIVEFVRDIDAKMKVNNVDSAFCEKMIERIEEESLSNNTQSHYFARFAFILNQAVKEGLLVSNPATKIDERPRLRDAEKVYLIESELKAFATVETHSAMESLIKDAFIFSALTGLRFSDVKRITDNHMEILSDNDIRLKIETQKTKKYISFILSPVAAEMVAERMERINAGELIFNLPSETYTNRLLKRLTEKAGINKHVTFHTARHTFATMLLTKGADIYTVSKLIGHSNISTTQVYAKIIDKKKDEAVKLLDGVL